MKASRLMKLLAHTVWGWACVLSLLWASPASATDNYPYRAGEYATVFGGLSRDGHWSITAHGDGEYGYDDFHLYLMREPGHEKVTTLPTKEHFDTGPISIISLWAPDSGSVAILHRSDRHVLNLRLIKVTEGKVRAIEGPTLAEVIGKDHRKPKVQYELTSRYYRFSWQEPNRFTLEEYVTFDAAEPIFKAGIEAYVEVDHSRQQHFYTSFAARGVGEITEDGKLRFANIKPVEKAPRNIVYSPHLLVDDWGLRNTETTMSSIEAAQKRK